MSNLNSTKSSSNNKLFGYTALTGSQCNDLRGLYLMTALSDRNMTWNLKESID
jgi:hypothetical protein